MQGKMETRRDEKVNGGLHWSQPPASWMAFHRYSKVDVDKYCRESTATHNKTDLRLKNVECTLLNRLMEMS
jgi:hypothetical protein